MNKCVIIIKQLLFLLMINKFEIVVKQLLLSNIKLIIYIYEKVTYYTPDIFDF